MDGMKQRRSCVPRRRMRGCEQGGGSGMRGAEKGKC